MSAFAPQGLLAGRFVIEREVGRGGVGIVYRAHDQLTNQAVALKIIAIPGVDAGEEARFRREGMLLAGLHHPAIVRVVAFGQLDDSAPYVAMEWLDGEDVAQRHKRARIPLSETLEIGATVADALAAAHDAGVIHRDVKPSNIFLTTDPDGGRPYAKLVDFGVAAAEDAKLTRTGAIIGTPAYMAPEQARGEAKVDERADFYALGATLFEMIAGRPPHIGPTPVAVLARLVTTPAPRLSEVFIDAPPRLDELLAKLLASQPADRPEAANDIATELRAIASELALELRPELTPSAHLPAHVGAAALTTTGRGGGTRLVTSIVATHVPKGAPRQRILTHLRARGADATELGSDAVVAHLGIRKAIGDEAIRALDLGLRLSRLNAAVGVATGRSRIDRTKPQGEVVDRAAALARDAQRGQLLADTTTTELSRGRYAMQLRGDGAAIVSAELSAKKDPRGGAPFVGREAELAQVLAAFERCVDDKTPVVVSLTGAPGVGKTRLRREALSRVASHACGPKIVLARCEPFAKSHALGTVAELTRGFSGVPKGTSLEETAAKMTSLLQHAKARLPEQTPNLVARLVANEELPPFESPGTRDALWLALTELTLGVVRSGPLALCIEDAQWSDAESIAWVDHLLARSAGKPLWVLLTTRPSFWRDDPERFEARDHVRLELRPLARRTVRAIATAILGERGQGDSGQAIAESIAEQSAGSPLFAEELARLAAQGRDASSAPTLEAALQVHLDALDENGREAAVKLAVYGSVGWDLGLEALGIPFAGEILRDLAAAEIVTEQADSRFPTAREWAFKHALMREVAYASLNEDTLRECHARAGKWLSSMGEDDAAIARHLELGGQSLTAAPFLEKAARRALAANALQEALALSERAVAFAEDKPTQFAAAQIMDEAWARLDARAAERATAVRAMQDAVYDEASAIRARGARVRYEDASGGGPDTSPTLEQLRKDAQAANLVDEEARCAAALAARYAFGGDFEKAASVADELLALSQRHSNPTAAVDAWQTLAVVHQTRGEVGAALAARRAAARAASESGLKTREATLTINVGFALTTVGAKDEARQAILSGIELAQAIGSSGTERHGKMILLGWAATFGSDTNVEPLLSEPRALAEAALGGSWIPHDRATLGVLFYRAVELLREPSRDAATQARTLMKTAAQGYRSTNMLDVLPVALGLWSESERRCGQPEQARELAREATALLAHGSPSLLNEAPAFLALHDACVDSGELREAREAIAQGIPRLVKRLNELGGTSYGKAFLTELAANAGLLAAAEAYGLIPPEIEAIL